MVSCFSRTRDKCGSSIHPSTKKTPSWVSISSLVISRRIERIRGVNLFSLSYMFIKNVYWLLHSSILILVLNRTFEFHRSFNIDVFVRYAVHSKRPSIKLQLFACWNLHILYSRFPNPYVAAIGKIKLLIDRLCSYRENNFSALISLM